MNSFVFTKSVVLHNNITTVQSSKIDCTVIMGDLTVMRLPVER